VIWTRLGQKSHVLNLEMVTFVRRAMRKYRAMMVNLRIESPTMGILLVGILLMKILLVGILLMEIQLIRILLVRRQIAGSQLIEIQKVRIHPMKERIEPRVRRELMMVIQLEIVRRP
jgi:hypothetical protein